jgi:hypothetical protein
MIIPFSEVSLKHDFIFSNPFLCIPRQAPLQGTAQAIWWNFSRWTNPTPWRD